MGLRIVKPGVGPSSLGRFRSATESMIRWVSTMRVPKGGEPTEHHGGPEANVHANDLQLSVEGEGSMPSVSNRKGPSYRRVRLAGRVASADDHVFALEPAFGEANRG